MINTNIEAANDNNRALGVVGGIKSLFCAACGEVEAATDGLCIGCIADANAHIDERRGEWEGERF